MEYMLEDKYSSHFSTADNVNGNHGGGVHFTVDDYFDFSNKDETVTDAFFDSSGGYSGDSSTVTVVDSCNSSASGGADAGQLHGGCRSLNESSHFSGNELCVPYDDLAELEWLSNFVEDSYSTGDLRFIPTSAVGATKITDATSSSSTTAAHSPPPIFQSEVSVPGKARSKRSRAAPCDWSSRLLVVSARSKTAAPASKRRAEATEAPGRKCLHCASEKTPQWRTGPLGPKTLCNACGVRYKSGRLVPEYRPAASPTFVLTKHSNSHRKVLELQRQKELHGQHQDLIDRGGSIFNGCDEFLVHQHRAINGPDSR